MLRKNIWNGCFNARFYPRRAQIFAESHKDCLNRMLLLASYHEAGKVLVCAIHTDVCCWVDFQLTILSRGAWLLLLRDAFLRSRYFLFDRNYLRFHLLRVHILIWLLSVWCGDVKFGLFLLLRRLLRRFLVWLSLRCFKSHWDFKDFRLQSSPWNCSGLNLSRLHTHTLLRLRLWQTSLNLAGSFDLFYPPFYHCQELLATFSLILFFLGNLLFQLSTTLLEVNDFLSDLLISCLELIFLLILLDEKRP